MMAAAYFEWFYRNRRLPVTRVLHTSVTVCWRGYTCSLSEFLPRLWCILAEREAFRSKPFSCYSPGYFGRAPPLQPSPAKYTAFYQRHFASPSMIFGKSGRALPPACPPFLMKAILCSGGRLISETFNALSVSIWLLDSQYERLVRASSTLHSEQEQAAIRLER